MSILLEALRKNACDIAKVYIDMSMEIIKDPDNGVDIAMEANIKIDSLKIQRELIRMTKFNNSKIGGVVVGCKE